MKKYLVLVLIICSFSFFFFINQVRAEDGGEKVFKAKVLRVLEEKELIRPSGEIVTQQNLELLILGGEDRGEIVEFYGIGEIDVVGINYYQAGDKVSVLRLANEENRVVYYVIDYVRGAGLWWLLITFTLILILIGGRKGIRAFLSLFLSLLIILKIFIPLVLQGLNPLLVGLPVVFFILIILVYLTEGWRQRSHVAILSIALSLIVTALLAVLFTYLTKLTGLGQGEIIYLIEASDQAINFRGLLLAAIIIGALGVINDMAVGQVATIEQIKLTNSKLSFKEIYKIGFKIGQSHLGAITNTLFLAYVGVSLPLLLLFSLGQEPFLTFSQIINNEEIATEIVRTLVGVIGVFLVMPISTFLGALFLKAGNK